MSAALIPVAPSPVAPSQVVAGRRAAAPARLLGALGVVGAFGFLVQYYLPGARGADGWFGQDARASLLNLAYLAGWTSSAVALRRARAAGRGRGAAALFAAQLVGLAAAAAHELQALADWRPLGDAAYAASDVFWPASHLVMLAVGAAVLRARAWTGWRRWTPLACGLMLPVVAAVGAAGGRAAALFAFGHAAAAVFAALGAALATAPAPAARAR